MSAPLGEFVEARLTGSDLHPAIGEAAETIAARLNGAAVLFYGSVLRTGDLDALLDFYVLTDGAERSGFLSTHLWPDISFEEVATAAGTVRAKVARMPLSIFEEAAAGRRRDSTIWTRFTQPAALVWAGGESYRKRCVAAVAAALQTAASTAAAIGPSKAPPLGYWRALFRETYKAEFRVERKDRSEQIVEFAADYYEAALPLAWRAADIPFDRDGGAVAPHLPAARRAEILRRWQRQRRAGKILNVARLVKAAFTVSGAAPYGLYKLERHTGVAVPLTPFREKHPILAAPGVFWRVWRAGSQ